MRNYIVSMVALSLVAVGCGDKVVDTSDTGVTTTDTGTTTTDTGDTTDTGATATETGTSTTDTGATTTDTGATATANTTPTAPVIEIVPGEPTEEDDLVCTITTESSDNEGDAVDYTFSWENNGTAWAGFTKDTVYVGDTIGFRATTPGDEWTCMVVPADGIGDGDAAEVTVTVTVDVGDTGSTDTALFTYFWEGSATITSDGVNYTDWNGTESFVYYNVSDGQVACEEVYDTTSTTSMSGCADCDFAFDVTFSNSVVTGPGCTAFNLVDQPGPYSSIGWGFASTSGNYSDVLMYYYPGDQSWFAAAYATTTMNGSDVDLEYLVNGQYFYYYTY